MNGDLGVLLTAAIALLGMSWLMRWVFRPSRHRRRTLVPGDAVPGLLTALSTGLRRGDATALRALLGDASIRSSLSARRDGLFDVLVFSEDLIRARSLLPPG